MLVAAAVPNKAGDARHEHKDAGPTVTRATGTAAAAPAAAVLPAAAAAADAGCRKLTLADACARCTDLSRVTEAEAAHAATTVASALRTGSPAYQIVALRAVLAAAAQGPVPRARLVKAGALQGLQLALSGSNSSSNGSSNGGSSDGLKAAAAAAAAALLAPGPGADAIASIAYKLSLGPQLLPLIKAADGQLASSAAAALGGLVAHSGPARAAAVSGNAPALLVGLLRRQGGGAARQSTVGALCALLPAEGLPTAAAALGGTAAAAAAAAAAGAEAGWDVTRQGMQDAGVLSMLLEELGRQAPLGSPAELAAITRAIGCLLEGSREAADAALAAGLLPWLLSVLRNGSPELVWGAARAVGAMCRASLKAREACIRAGAPALLVALLSATSAPGSTAGSAAGTGKSSTAGAGGVPTSAAAWQSKCRVQAALALGSMAAGTAATAAVTAAGGVKALAAVLRSPERNERLAAAQALGCLEMKAHATSTAAVPAVPLLAAQLAGSKGDTELAGAAAGALASILSAVPEQRVAIGSSSAGGSSAGALAVLVRLLSVPQQGSQEAALSLMVQLAQGGQSQRLALVRHGPVPVLLQLAVDGPSSLSRVRALECLASLMDSLEDVEAAVAVAGRVLGRRSDSNGSYAPTAGPTLHRSTSSSSLATMPRAVSAAAQLQREHAAALHLAAAVCRLGLTEAQQRFVADSGVLRAAVKHLGQSSDTSLRCAALLALAAMTSRPRRQLASSRAGSRPASPYHGAAQPAMSAASGQAGQAGRPILVEALLQQEGALQLLVDALGSTDAAACQAATAVISNVAGLGHRDLLAETTGSVPALLQLAGSSDSRGSSTAAGAAATLGGMALDCESVQRQLVASGAPAQLQQLVRSAAPEVKQAARLALRSAASSSALSGSTGGSSGLSARIATMHDLMPDTAAGAAGAAGAAPVGARADKPPVARHGLEALFGHRRTNSGSAGGAGAAAP